MQNCCNDNNDEFFFNISQRCEIGWAKPEYARAEYQNDHVDQQANRLETKQVSPVTVSDVFAKQDGIGAIVAGSITQPCIRGQVKIVGAVRVSLFFLSSRRCLLELAGDKGAEAILGALRNIRIAPVPGEVREGEQQDDAHDTSDHMR